MDEVVEEEVVVAVAEEGMEMEEEARFPGREEASVVSPMITHQLDGSERYDIIR